MPIKLSIAAIFKSEAIPEAERLDLNHVIEEIQKRGKQARILADADAIVNAIAPELRERDVVAILSNGGFGGIYEKLPQRLRELGSHKQLGGRAHVKSYELARWDH